MIHSFSFLSCLGEAEFLSFHYSVGHVHAKLHFSSDAQVLYIV